MECFWRDDDFGIDLLNADVIDGLRALPDESVQCVVTSPPYWGLRDYGTAEWEGGDPECSHCPADTPTTRGLHSSTLEGCRETTGHQKEGYGTVCARCGAVRVDQQIGLEATIDEYIETMVSVFREVRRVLRADGTLWLNLGDCYAGHWGQKYRHPHLGKHGFAGNASCPPNKATPPWSDFGLKPKDLVGIPWRVALALQADGWWLRSDIIWQKMNPMPESVTDRPTKSHEHIFLLAKSQRYFYDQDAVREPQIKGAAGSTFTEGKTGVNGIGRVSKLKREETSGRNKRDVWTVNTVGFPEAHFATFPPKLIEPCVLAGSAAQSCSECGAPWERMVERESMVIKRTHNHPPELRTRTSGTMVKPQQTHTIGFRPTCGCYDHLYIRDFPQAKSARKRHQRETSGEWFRRARKRPGREEWPTVPSVVLDPFGGSGTTALVAAELGRRCVLIELSEEYCGIAVKRVGERLDELRIERAQLTLAI